MDNDSASPQGQDTGERGSLDYDECVENGGHDWIYEGQMVGVYAWNGGKMYRTSQPIYNLYTCRKCQATRETVQP